MIKSQDDLNQDDGVGRTMTLLKAIEQLEKTEVELEKVEKQLKIAVETITALAIVGKYSIAIEALQQIKELDK